MHRKLLGEFELLFYSKEVLKVKGIMRKTMGLMMSGGNGSDHLLPFSFERDRTET